jgi:hypothetical protein
VCALLTGALLDELIFSNQRRANTVRHPRVTSKLGGSVVEYEGTGYHASRISLHAVHMIFTDSCMQTNAFATRASTVQHTILLFYFITHAVVHSMRG